MWSQNKTLFALCPDALQGALAMPVSNNKLPLWDWETLPLPGYYCLHIIWKQTTSYKPSLESKFENEAYQSYLAKDCRELFRILQKSDCSKEYSNCGPQMDFV